MGQLVVSLEALEKWLLGLPLDKNIGVPWAGGSCPISTFIKSQGYLCTCVTKEKALYYIGSYAQKILCMIELDEEITEFITAIDLLLTTKVTVSEALEVLRKIK